jgi:hypothetical protein
MTNTNENCILMTDFSVTPNTGFYLGPFRSFGDEAREETEVYIRRPIMRSFNVHTLHNLIVGVQFLHHSVSQSVS